jgi:hypothetical protein
MSVCSSGFDDFGRNQVVVDSDSSQMYIPATECHNKQVGLSYV